MYNGPRIWWNKTGLILYTSSYDPIGQISFDVLSGNLFTQWTYNSFTRPAFVLFIHVKGHL